MKTLIKFCGLRRNCDIEAVNSLSHEYGVDFIGFVFAKGSKRYVTETEAAKLKALLSRDISAVGVFVREDIENIINLIESGVIDAVQLHGGEDESYIEALREELDRINRKDIKIIKAFKATDIDLKEETECSSADLVLIDSPIGGSGKTFDYKLLSSITRPFFLAGGLCAENIAESIKMLQPLGVDVSSGIESNGTKDSELMREFVRQVRQLK